MNSSFQGSCNFKVVFLVLFTESKNFLAVFVFQSLFSGKLQFQGAFLVLFTESKNFLTMFVF